MTSIVTRSRSGAKKSSAALTGNMIYQDAVSNDSNTTSLDETGASSRSRNCKDKSKKSKAKKRSEAAQHLTTFQTTSSTMVAAVAPVKVRQKK